MNDLASLLKKLESGEEFVFRKMDLITQAVAADKRFLPLSASQFYVDAVERFWESAPDWLSLMPILPFELDGIMQTPTTLANAVIEQITTFIEVNHIVLTGDITDTNDL